MDFEKFMADYPPPPMFERTVGTASDEQIRELQSKRAIARVADAWSVPFYRERWSAAGLEPGDIVSLEDLDKIPTFNSDDIKTAIDECPPYGTHHPFTAQTLTEYLPLKIQTSGGTTGLPRTTAFDNVAWEVQGVQVARALWAQGARPGDVVQIPFTNALGNSAWSAYTGIHHWLGGVPLTTGSGVVTPSERQLEYAALYGTGVWYAMGDYLVRLAEVADEIGFDLHSLPTKFLHAFLGTDTGGNQRKLIQEAWDAPVYDNYGAHEIGLVAFECVQQNGRHVCEDTVYLQVVDIDDPSQVLATGAPGNLVATSLHRNVPPIIRYNLRDKLEMSPRERCACGLMTIRLSTFLGRSDDMVKLRGQNIYPMACQDVVTADPRSNGQFLCVVSYEGTELSRREEMTIKVERRDTNVDAKALQSGLEAVFHRDLGVRVPVEVVEAGELAQYTRFGGEGKVRRLLDLRKRGS
jgi:phenylacetate-CoA ligase